MYRRWAGASASVGYVVIWREGFLEPRLASAFFRDQQVADLFAGTKSGALIYAETGCDLSGRLVTSRLSEQIEAGLDALLAHAREDADNARALLLAQWACRCAAGLGVLASAGLEQSNNIRLWDASTGEMAEGLAHNPLEGHTSLNGAFAVAWSNDGKTLASGGDDSHVILVHACCVSRLSAK